MTFLIIGTSPHMHGWIVHDNGYYHTVINCQVCSQNETSSCKWWEYFQNDESIL